MDKLAELTHGAKVVLGSAIALLVFSFFDWFQIDGTSYGVSMWSGIGFVGGLLLIALIAWQAVRLANINLEIGVTPSMVTAALAILTLIFVFIRFIAKPGGGLFEDAVDRTIWAWIGLVLAIIIVGGAWANMKAAGEGLADVREKLGSIGGGDKAAPPESAAPAAAAAPAAPAPAAPEAAAAPEAPSGDDTPQST